MRQPIGTEWSLSLPNATISLNCLAIRFDKSKDQEELRVIGHGVPSSTITLERGQLVHLDMGIIVDGYSSDIQRCWYIAEPGETELPQYLAEGLAAVSGLSKPGPTSTACVCKVTTRSEVRRSINSHLGKK
jgi:hypothetical protein